MAHEKIGLKFGVCQVCAGREAGKQSHTHGLVIFVKIWLVQLHILMLLLLKSGHVVHLDSLLFRHFFCLFDELGLVLFLLYEILHGGGDLLLAAIFDIIGVFPTLQTQIGGHAFNRVTWLPHRLKLRHCFSQRHCLMKTAVVR